MPKIDKKALGRRIAARRDAMKFSQQTLATILDMAQQGISDIENGIVERPGRFREMAIALLTTEDWLLYRDGPEVSVNINGLKRLLADLQEREEEKEAEIVAKLIQATGGSSVVPFRRHRGSR